MFHRYTHPRLRIQWFVFVVLLGVFALSMGAAKTAVAATCTSSTTGNWGDISTWDCGIVPTVADDVIIQSPHTINVNAASVAKTVTIQNSGTLTFGGNYELRIQPADNDVALNLMTGGNLVTNNTGTISIRPVGNTQASIAGNPLFHNLTIVRQGSANIATVNFTGTNLTVGNVLQMNTTTAFNATNTIVSINSVIFTNTGSTATQQVLNLANSTVSIVNALPSVSGGSTTFGTINFTNATVNVSGNLNPRQSATANTWIFTGSTVTFNGSTTQTIIGTLNFNDIVVGSGAIVEIGSGTITASTLRHK